MSSRSIRRRPVRTMGSALLLTAVLANPALAAGPPATADLEWLRQQTVRIQVQRTDAAEENGSGVLLCQVDKQAYVLTANHVIFGKSRTGRLGSLLDVQKIRLSFYKDIARPVEEVQDEEGGRASVFTKSLVPGKDLLLLSFEVPEDLAAFATPSPTPPAEDIPNGPHTVQAIGYRQAASESWSAPQGAILGRENGILQHSAAIGEGFSGGPLFDESGAWIGLNIQASEDESTPGGRALPIDEVLPAIHKWVPASCLPRDDEKKAKAAIDLYRDAMRQVSLRAWDKAEKTLRDAIALNPLEGGSVHLQGMRYTEYLPHYHLGLTLYHLDRYGEALRELQVSEVQGVIRENKRFKDLKHIRANCQEKMKTQALGSEAKQSP